MIDLIIIIMAGIVLLFLLSCCFMVARLLDEEISMYELLVEFISMLVFIKKQLINEKTK